MNKIILALDTTKIEEAIAITKKIKDRIFTIKLGLEFFNAHGKTGIKKFNEIGINNLMLDLKLKDIPETIYKSIKALSGIQFSQDGSDVQYLTANATFSYQIYEFTTL